MATKKSKSNAKIANTLRQPEINEPQAKSAKFNFRSNYFVYAVIIALCLFIYAQVIGFDFINIDDDQYVYENPFVTTGLNIQNIVWAFTAFHSSNWHPLTWISHQLDVSFFGLNSGAHHFVNVIFHIANSTLLFVLLKQLTKSFWKSAVVAVIFAIHPAHVESVAWIAERKDVLSTLFWLLSTVYYVRFARDMTSKNVYWISVSFFALGLMAKPMLITLPFTLILIDYWALGRFEKWNLNELIPLIKEKFPFFALSLASGVITIFAQSTSGAIQSIEKISLADRISNAIISYGKYVALLFYPANLGVWYPFETAPGNLQIIVSAILLAGLTVIAIWQIAKRKYLFFGWFWFLGTLVPVIGILQVGGQSMADRYTYVPFIGLTIALVWFAGEVVEKLSIGKRTIAAVCGILAVAFSVLSFLQAANWKNNETLFVHTLSVTEKNYFVEHNFCNYLKKENRLDQALELCKSAIGHNPNLADAYNTLGSVQLKQNDLTEAENNFQKSIELNPDYVMAYANLSIVKSKEGKPVDAAEFLTRAVEKDRIGFFDKKKQLDLYSNLAVESFKQKSYDIAEEFFRKSIEITPDNVDFQRNLALSLHLQGKSDDAIKILLDIIRQKPNIPEVYNSLGLIYAEQNNKQEAIVNFRKALQINPGFEPARNNLLKIMQ